MTRMNTAGKAFVTEYTLLLRVILPLHYSATYRKVKVMTEKMLEPRKTTSGNAYRFPIAT